MEVSPIPLMHAAFCWRAAEPGEFRGRVVVIAFSAGSIAVADLGRDGVQILNGVPRVQGAPPRACFLLSWLTGPGHAPLLGRVACLEMAAERVTLV